MKNTIKITTCGVISALAVGVMLATNIPVLLYVFPIAAGVLFMVPAIEFGTKWGFLCFGVTAVLSLVLPTEKEATVVFIGILGYYPILKMLIERIGKRVVEYLIKFSVFNVMIVASYAVVVNVLGIDAFSNDKFSLLVTEILFLVAGNVAFLLVDIALTKIIQLYFFKIRKTVRKTLGIKERY